MDPSRRQALLHAKLGALVSSGWGDADRRREPFPGGAALVDEGAAWLLPDLPERLADPSRRTRLLDLLRHTEDEPSLLGASSHLLAIGHG